jgi:hypothetical protein
MFEYIVHKYVQLDWKLCNFYMKLTGKSRSSYFDVLGFSILASLGLFYILMPDRGIIFPTLIIGMWTFIVVSDRFFYNKWLRNPSVGLRTVKIDSVYWNYAVYFSCVLWICFQIFFGIINITSMILSRENLLADVLYNIWLLSVSLQAVAKFTSGPPQPDNTFWQKAKSKIQAFSKGLKTPRLSPIPVSSRNIHYTYPPGHETNVNRRRINCEQLSYSKPY